MSNEPIEGASNGALAVKIADGQPRMVHIEMDAPVPSDLVPTQRRIARDETATPPIVISAPNVVGAVEVQQLLSPMSDPLRSDPGGAEATSTPRRRSRRTVKITDDAVPRPQTTSNLQLPTVASVAVSVPSLAGEPVLPVVPAELVSPLQRSAMHDEGSEVIRPLPIISIDAMPPSSFASPARDSDWLRSQEVGDSSGMAREAPLLEVHVLAHSEDLIEAIAAAPAASAADEVEIMEDHEAEEPDDFEAVAISAHEEIAIDIEEPPPPTKRPPPPPPKRVAAEVPGAASPTPSLARPVEAAPPQVQPSAPSAFAATPSNFAAAEMNRKRQKPWWEDIFSDDFLRTMEKIEPNIIRKECDFIEDRIGLEKGAIMLDVACGSGGHAVELASRGYHVVGYDLSLAMLARAQDEAQERGQKINFLQGDMREMAFEEAFDGMYSWGTSFGYFDEEKNLNVLSRIHRGLRQGGMFLLDVTNRDYICGRQPSLVWFEGDGCVCMDEMLVDFFTSRLRVKRTVMFEDGRSRECDYSIRLYGLHELGKMLHDTGFKVIEVTGHPAHPGVFFGSESPRIIVLAERA